MVLIRCLWLLLPASSGMAESLPAFLLGNWQINQKPQYERWSMIDQQHYVGEVISVINNQPVVKERLSLTIENKQLTYTAQVLNQNQGQKVLFVGSITETGFRVSNEKHDFPQIIEYIKVSDQLIEARVTDKNGQGFTQKLSQSKGVKQQRND